MAVTACCWHRALLFPSRGQQERLSSLSLPGEGSGTWQSGSQPQGQEAAGSVGKNQPLIHHSSRGWVSCAVQRGRQCLLRDISSRISPPRLPLQQADVRAKELETRDKDISAQLLTRCSSSQAGGGCEEAHPYTIGGNKQTKLLLLPPD